jgi:2OG-Fe(II) oxygenase superfamily
MKKRSWGWLMMHLIVALSFCVLLWCKSVAAWASAIFGLHAASLGAIQDCSRPSKASGYDQGNRLQLRTLPRSRSTLTLITGAEEDFSGKYKTGEPLARLLASSSISKDEIDVICQLITSTLSDSEEAFQSRSNFEVEWASLNQSSLPPGVTGRSLILQLSAESLGYTVGHDDTLEIWQMELSEQVDALVHSADKSIGQPILLSVEWMSSLSDDTTSDRLSALIDCQISDYGLKEPMENQHDSELSTFFKMPTDDSYVPTLRYEVDGAPVFDLGFDEPNVVWDTSSFVVWDKLVSGDLRRQLLATVLGQESDDGNEKLWDDIALGPDPSRWVAGTLFDLPTEGDAIEAPHSAEGLSFGLSDEALDELCSLSPPDAFQEFEAILVNLFPDFVVSRLPEAVLGACVTPITANAPCAGQLFEPHIDADPCYAPPSPWTDVFGRYSNRSTGKPRFVSCIVYLNEEWHSSDWGAPTRFYDVATDTAVDIEAKPGRVVIMDQDITHSVVAPLLAAGKRPRYSLVWKLILHPKRLNQDMRRSFCAPFWPEPIRIGSAKRRQAQDGTE